MGVYNEQGEALGKPDSSVMLPKVTSRFGRRHDTHGPLALRRKGCKLPPKDTFNDTMYIVGGWSQEDPSCPVEQFCPQYNEWHMMASMIQHRGNVAVGTLDGKVYTVGGDDNVSCFRSVERYDPDTDSWSSDVAPLSSPRSGVCLVELDGHLWALGGFDGMAATNTVERYDPKMNTWKKQAPMLTRRSGAAAAALDGHLYVVGGNDGDMPLDSVECYSPVDGTWSMCPPMLSPRENAGCAVFLGRLYVAGGRDELLLELSAVETYDLETLRWTPVKRMRSKRNNVSLMVFNGTLLAAGGSDNFTNLKTLEVYNHETNTWRHFGSMKTKHPGGQIAIMKREEGYLL
ncbi:kelch-like protein diablo isoform X1 [Hypomesus transpacificus]|uniref:kelch-like protein diablo isoform X1 n=2 Tax=Hypomesus transpacificus TaxID=137520 RepID=UPI001F083B11|nr:kelch-like protein diablo isoform X1 [Hypomesus transpacificus]